MLNNANIKIAVITEEQYLQDYVVMLLVGEDYQVKAFASQYDALAALEDEHFDLIISEFQSSNINGLDICRTLRGNFLYNLVPIIFLIPDTEELSAAKLTFVGGDDYIKKSTIRDELFIKVKLNLYRIARYYDIHSITRLPGQTHLLKELEKRLSCKEFFAIAYLSIANFDAFNYRYGFQRGNEVVKFTSSIVLQFLREYGKPTDFLAHIQNSHFVFITSSDNTDLVMNNIITAFDRPVTSFYDTGDGENGFILLKDRALRMQKIPLMHIHIGVLINNFFPALEAARIMQIIGELHTSAQANPDKSIYIKEERK